MKVVIFHFGHLTGAVEVPARALEAALRAYGIEAHCVSVRGRHTAQLYTAAALHGRCDIAVSVGGMPLTKTIAGRPLYEVFGDRFFFWTLDPIIYDINRDPPIRAYFEAAQSSQRLGFLFPDRSYRDLVRPLLTRPHLAQYFPFGGFYETPGIPWPERREQRIALFATIDRELANSAYDTVDHALEAQGAESLSAAELTTLGQAVQAREARANVSCVAQTTLVWSAKKVFQPESLRLLTTLDAFEKRRRRLLAVGELKGLPVDLYGQGWETHFGEVDSFRFKGSVPFSHIGRLMRNYAAVLNFDPNWDDGLHDRVFTALGNGCRVLTNANAALPEIGLEVFEANTKALGSYQVNSPDLRDTAKEFIASDALKADEVLKFRALNSWYARVDEWLSSM